MPTIKSYQQAMEYLKGKQERPYAHNTRIKADGESVTVLYHGNPVVKMYPDRITFDSCGWRSMTTKERINWFLPDGFRLYQERSVWYVCQHMGESWTFADGFTVHSDGTVSGYADAEQEQEVKHTIKRIKAYVDGYIKALLDMELGQPSGGDCWYCLMITQTGESLGEATHNTGHIESHMEESYYVPSLLMRAYEHNKRLSMMTRDGVARLMDKQAISTWQAEIVERDVRTCLTNYIKHELNIPGK